jgi:membrane protein
MRQCIHIGTAIWAFLNTRVLPSRPVQLVIQTGLKWDRDNCAGMAAALSYYALFSVFPLLLVISSIVGSLVGPDTDAFGYINNRVVQYLPPAAHAVVVDTMVALDEKSAEAGIVGFGLLFLAAATLFAILRQSVNKIWESPVRISEADSVLQMVLFFIFNKLVAYLLVLATALFLLVSFVANVFIRTVIELINHFQANVAFIQNVDELLLTRWLQAGTSVGILSAALCLLFKLLPTVRPQWRDVWLGAVLTAVMLVGLQQLAAEGVVSIFNKFHHYGTIGSVMVLLLWIFLGCQIFFVGCEMSFVYAKLYGSRRDRLSRPLVSGAAV